MPELIAYILDLYLDIKHWVKTKKRRKFEKENNLTKSIVWHPLTKPFLILLLLLAPIIFCISLYNSVGKNKQKTIKRMTEIAKLLDAEKIQFGNYPLALKNIIRNNPLRNNIDKDYWETSFMYTTSNKAKSYQLISLGADKKLNTKDDIIQTSK